MSKYAKLIMVAVSDGKDPKRAGQSNKFYEMKENGGNFDVTFGRVEATSEHTSYPMSKWQSKYNEKLRKGYKDVTHTVMERVDISEDTPQKLAKIQDSKVDNFLNLMKKYTDGLVASTYTVKSQSVTQAQVDNAQNFLDKLKKCAKKDVTSINSTLLELYMEIPRRMGDVRDYLLPNINIDKVVEQEQDNLDAMASQVKMYNKKENKVAQKSQKTLLDLLGIKKMKEINGSKEIDYLTKQISGKRLEAIFEVEKDTEDKRFDNWLAKQDNKKTKYVYHGTKCTSVIPILEQGLKIRPSGNFQFTGKAYGNGNYFSEQFSTSLGYTDGYRSGDAVMLIYEIHTGKESKSSFRDYSDCKRAGYDSFEGGWLRVAYKEEQARIKYILWLK